MQLVKKLPTFHGTRRFITAITSIRQLSLSWASPIQSIYPHPTSWRSILILSTHLRLGLPSGLFPSGFPTKTLYTPSRHPYAPHAQPISFFSIIYKIYIYIIPFEYYHYICYGLIADQKICSKISSLQILFPACLCHFISSFKSCPINRHEHYIFELTPNVIKNNILWCLCPFNLRLIRPSNYYIFHYRTETCKIN